MKPIIYLLLVMGLLQSAHALRITAQPEDAYELRLPEVVFPISASGALGLAACANCRHASLQLAASTEYYIANEVVPYQELLSTVQQLRIRNAASQLIGVLVFYDVATLQVNRLKLNVSTVN